MASEALVLAFLVVAVAVPDHAEVVEPVAVDSVARDVAAADAAVVDTEVVADDIEVVDNSIGVADVAAEIAVASVVQNLPACKTHPGNATAATVVD